MLDRIKDLIKAYKCIIQDIKDEQGEQCAISVGDIIDIGRIQAYECVVMDLERVLKE